MKTTLFILMVVVIGFFGSLMMASFGAQQGKKTDAPDTYSEARSTLLWCSAVSILIGSIIQLYAESKAAHVGVTVIILSLLLNIAIYSYAAAFLQSARKRQRMENKVVIYNRPAPVHQASGSDEMDVVAQWSAADKRSLEERLRVMRQENKLKTKV